MVLIDWFRTHPMITGWLFGLSLLVFVGSLIVMPLIIARMSPDYFISAEPGPQSWRKRHAVTRVLARALKNLVGLILLLAGIAMLVLPGQGIITILVAISLLDFPGKRRIELLFVKQRHVRRAINWIRQRAGRPALILPDRDRS